MINYIQMNQNKINKIIDDSFEKYSHIQKNTLKKTNSYINNICVKYNIENEKLCKQLFEYIIQNKKFKNDDFSKFLCDVETVLHSGSIDVNILLSYSVTIIKNYFLLSCK